MTALALEVKPNPGGYHGDARVLHRTTIAGDAPQPLLLGAAT